MEWRGIGVEEVGIETSSGKTLVEVSPRYFRPSEVDLLVGDPTKAREELNWKPRVGFSELVRIMMRAEKRA